MASNSLQSENKSVKHGFIFLLIASVFLFLSPALVQSVYSLVTQSRELVSVSSEVDYSSRKEQEYPNRFIVGEVELYYDQWIISEPRVVNTPISFMTPNRWTGHSDGQGGSLSSVGYASYRYVMKGLVPGERITAFQNVEIPNRIFLNGVLSSSAGSPTMDGQSTFVDLRGSVSHYVTVPSNGIVEYVMEVGNTGDGGAVHIGAIYREGHRPRSFTGNVISTIAFGVMVGAVGVLALLLSLAQKRIPILLLSGSLAALAFVFLLSRDSIFIGASVFYNAPLFDTLTVFFRAVGIAMAIAYLWQKDERLLNRYEAMGLTLGLGLTVLVALGVHGTTSEWVPFLLLLSFPLYLLTRLILQRNKSRPPYPIYLYLAAFGGYSLISILYAANLFHMLFVYYPTIICFVMAIIGFVASVVDIYQTSLKAKDEAVLARRYQNISSRALARLSTEAESIAPLKMIEGAYEESIDKGDKKLLGFSSLTRRRLMALRQEKIPLQEECELEGRLNDLRNEIYARDTVLLLDVEKGTFEVPPLIFEDVIDELSLALNEDETVTIAEDKGGVRLLYPLRLVPSSKAMASIQERCSYCGLIVSRGKGMVRLSKRRKR